MASPPLVLRRVKRPLSLRRLVSLLLILYVAARVVLVLAAGRESPDRRPLLREDRVYRSVRVIDGDTLLLAAADDVSAGALRVRLLGVDTPETVAPGRPAEPWGEVAAAFTRRFVANQELRVRLDKRRVDRYGRRLAHVFLPDGRSLGEELARHGLARASSFPGDNPSLSRVIQRAEKEARVAGLGIWSGGHE